MNLHELKIIIKKDKKRAAPNFEATHIKNNFRLY